LLFHKLFNNIILKRRKEACLIGLVLTFIFLNLKFHFFKTFWLEVSGPVLKSLDTVWHCLETTKERYIALQHVKEENIRLRKEISTLKAKLAACERIKKVNQRLEALLKFKKKIRYPTLGARVIGYAPEFLPRMIFIDRGSKDGVGLNFPVVCKDGTVGQVVAVSPHYAKVLLLISNNSHVAVMSERTRTQGIFVGNGINQGEVFYINAEADVKKGDLFITSGMDGIFPKGMQVGQVVSISKSKASLFQKVILKTSVDFTKLEEVLVILKPPRILKK
jgi:rod shape-determining protein MreC